MRVGWLVLLAACDPKDEGWTWDLPAGFPEPAVPEDNPMSAAKVELGRHLFFEKRMSVTGEMSCGTCHQQSKAFTDGKAHAEGATGQLHPRGSMAVINVGYSSVLTWANPLMDSLEKQTLGPIFGETPVELGLTGIEDDFLATLKADEAYPDMFGEAFTDDGDPFTMERVVQAISAFERTVISGDSPWDRYAYGGDSTAVDDSVVNGANLFFSERLECHHCHGGFNFSLTTHWKDKSTVEITFENTGLYNVDGAGAYPAENPGIYAVTGVPEDMGRFRAPTLRNIAVTAPYMHDGSLATLEEVIDDHYARGGRLTADGPNAGDGSLNPRKSEFMVGFELTAQERADLLAFLNALTDEAFLTNPAFADPFQP